MNEEMDFEKQSTKRSFLQLFDWNVKSRKQLFSNKSEASVAAEKSKQGKENLNDSTFSLPEQVHRNGYGPGPNIVESYSLTCSSSPSGDIIYGTKVPGVVARLMGLDSLPTSDAVEPSFNPLLVSQSFRDSHYSTGIHGFQSQDHVMVYDGMRNKLDGFIKNPVELMVHKVQSRPIERFQTEMLPPKSAKPISITHHRFLSPIKSPGFIQTMDSDYLMEAAAKLIEQSPRSIARHKLPSLGSSSVPLKMQDVKEKVEVVEKSRRILETSLKGKEHSFTQYVNRRTNEQAQGRGEGQDLLRASGKPKTVDSDDSRRKKSTSLPVQAKPNIAKRDGLTSVDSHSSASRRQPYEVNHSFAGRNLERKHKNVEVENQTSKQSNVLRQSNQKQKSESNEERDSLRHSLVNGKERKPSSSTGFSRPNTTVDRIVVSNDSLSKKTDLLTSDSRREKVSSMAKKTSGKKEATNRNHVSDGSLAATIRQGERSINCNYDTQKSSTRDSADGKSGMDIVSFTFNSPIKKPSPESTLSGKSPESKRRSFLLQESCNYQSNSGLDVACGDALSILLEQKLKELASRVESSQQDVIHSRLLCGSADSSRGSVQIFGISSKSSEFNSQLDPSEDKTGSSFRFDGSSSSSLSESWLGSMLKWQGSNEVAKSTVPSYSEGSCKSLDTSRSISTKGSKRGSSIEALEIMGRSSSRNSQGVDVELLDTASSTSLRTSMSDITPTFNSSIKESSNWELDYIRCIVSNSSLMLEEFALGQVQKLIAPDFFDLFEDGKSWWNQHVEEDLKLSRKALFDCVGESLELRCTLINKGRKHWTKLTTLLGQTDQLSEEVYREISCWTSMEDLMTDELVEKDMSTQLGRWVDFEMEAFEEGMEMERVILTSLLDEFVTEFFLSS